VFGPVTDYTFILTADCKFDDLKPLVLKYIGGLPAGKHNTDYVYHGPLVSKEPAEIKRKADDSPKATVSLIFQQDKLGESLRMYDLKSEMIQNLLRMKLLEQLREKMGMVYSVGVSCGSTLHPSELIRNTISFSCLPENAELLIDKTIEQIKDMISDPSGFENELKNVKTNMIKEMQINLQKDSFWGGFIRNSIFNNETDWSYIKNFVSVIDSVTTKQLAEMMEKGFIKTKAIEAIMYPKDNLTKLNENQSK
jgi:zinc protease